MSFVRVYFFHLRLCAFVFSFFCIFCFRLIHCNYENVFCYSYILLSTSTKILFTQIESNLLVRCGVTDTGTVNPESLLESGCELWLTIRGRGRMKMKRKALEMSLWKISCVSHQSNGLSGATSSINLNISYTSYKLDQIERLICFELNYRVGDYKTISSRIFNKGI